MLKTPKALHQLEDKQPELDGTLWLDPVEKNLVISRSIYDTYFTMVSSWVSS